MDRTKALIKLENHYLESLAPEQRVFLKAEIRRIYIPSYAEDLIRHLERLEKNSQIQTEGGK